MKTSCINHPAKEPLIIIRKWQVEACDGNHCAAALLSFFEYWHNIRLEQSIKAAQANDIAERHGDGRTQDESFIQWHSSNDLERGLLGLYAHGKIAEAVNLLSGKGFIRTLRNPNPRYKFDATKHFVFNDDAVNEWIESRSSENGESIARKSETGSRKGKTVAQKREMTIGEETTSEITNETTEDTPADAGDVAKPQAESIAEKPKSPVKVFAEKWWESYKRHTGMPYSPPNRAADFAAAKRITSNGRSVAELIELAEFAWEPGNLERFYWSQAQSIAGFASRLTNIQAAFVAKRGRKLSAEEREENVRNGQEHLNVLADW